MTYWFCEHCQNYGCVGHFKHADVSSVMNDIKVDHVRSAPRWCEWSKDKVRVSERSLRPKKRTAPQPAGDHT